MSGVTLNPDGTLTGDVEWEGEKKREAKTHRHLLRGEAVAAGDIYGGRDWGFVFTVGTSQVDRPKAGEPCDGLLGYRVRRAL